MSFQTSSTEAQANLDQLCDRVIETGEAVVIARSDGKNIALIAEAELESLLETFYLLRSPTNATRLLSALERAKAKTLQPQAVDKLLEKLRLHEEDMAENEMVAKQN